MEFISINVVNNHLKASSVKIYFFPDKVKANTHLCSYYGFEMLRTTAYNTCILLIYFLGLELNQIEHKSETNLGGSPTSTIDWPFSRLQ